MRINRTAERFRSGGEPEKESEAINVCVICEADGVMEAAGNWYCINHLEDGFLDVADYLARVRGWDREETADHLRSWLAQ
jgi:hypothetical protein